MRACISFLVAVGVLAGSLPLTAQSGSVNPDKAKVPTVHLEGDTRACHGRFDLTPLSMRWTSTWSRCIARSPQLISQDAYSWAFQIKSSKSCPFEVIKLVNVSKKKDLPRTEYPLWLVDGFTTISTYQQDPTKPQISCNMQ
jgi:hypothetical protein